MKLYFSKGACSLVVRIIINELGLESSYESVDLKNKKTTEGTDYYKINPKGVVPALEINQNEILTENAIILQYLADSNHAEQLLPKIGVFNRYRVLEWLNFITTELHKRFSLLFNPTFPEEAKEKTIIPHLNNKFAYVDKQLQGQEYLFGDNFTLPDAYLFVMIMWAQAMKINITQYPNILRFYANLLKRKSIRQSLEQEGLHIKETAV